MKNNIPIFAFLFITFSQNVFAQAPTITSFNPTSGPVGTSITITGTNFSTTPANDIVYFGATRATVVSAMATQLVVTVPIGATYQPITVTVDGLTGFSNSPFPITFPNDETIDNSTLSSGISFATGTGPYSIVIGDIDGDGKSDIVVSNLLAKTFSVLRNTSTTGVFNSNSFAPKVDFSTGTGSPQGITLGDLDGDGKLDVVVTLPNTVSVFKNISIQGEISTNSFDTKIDIVTGNSSTRGVAIGDIDGDGMLDIVKGSIYPGPPSTYAISVLKNTGSLGVISFASKVDFATTESSNSLSLRDIDGDTKTDIGFTTSGSDGNWVSILRNTSSTGVINSNSFSNRVDFAAGSSPASLAIGDLDGDGKPELSVVSSTGNGVFVLRNTSTSGTISSNSFSSAVKMADDEIGESVAINDIDGDGKQDLIKGIRILRNISSIGSITSDSFASSSTPGFTRISAIGDLDNDGKPDIVGFNYNSNSILIFRNKIKSTIITWADPLPISYGTALSVTQLNATANVTGTFNYFPFNGILLKAGTNQSLKVWFSPNDEVNYKTISAQVQLTVNKATPIITWTNPAAITFGTALSTTQLNATANVPGTFTYNPTIGTLLNAGANQTLSVNFVPIDNVNYNSVNNIQNQITINKADPVITWTNPVSITYGTTLSTTHLNATSNVPGSFTYSPPIGAVLGAGANQTLSVNFVPVDGNNYNSVSNTQVLTVNKAIPIITWANPTAITLGTTLSTTQLNATANIPGTFTYNPPIGTVLGGGANQTLNVNFVPIDNVNYNSISNTQVQITVNKRNQTITFGPLPNVTVGDLTFSLSATASSGLAVKYTTSSNKVTLNGNIVTTVSAGRDIITASQPGDADYDTAPSVSQSFCINPAQPTISISDVNTASPTLTSSATSSNQWFVNGTAITGATNTTLSVATAGIYTVQAKVDDCASLISSNFPVIVTGDINLLPEPLSVYPNPSLDFIFITGITQSVVESTVIDMVGKVCGIKLSQQGNFMKGDISNLTTGTYILKITDGNQAYQIKFIKQ